MNEKTVWVRRLLDVLANYPPRQVDEPWLDTFRAVVRIPEGVYPPGTYCERRAKSSVYLIPEELIPWLGTEGYLTEDELILLDAELLLEAAG